MKCTKFDVHKFDDIFYSSEFRTKMDQSFPWTIKRKPECSIVSIR